MDPIKVEVFLSVPACSGGVAVRRLIDDVAKQYGDEMDVVYRQGRDKRSVHRGRRDVRLAA